MFYRKPLFIVLAFAALGVFAGGYVYFGRSSKEAPAVVSVKRADIVQEVNVTGRVKPASEANLAFEKIGKVTSVYVKVGERALAGQVLVVLDNAEILASLADAEANVRAKIAKLDELKRGTRSEEIRIQEVKVENAKVAVEDAKRNLLDKIQDAYTKSDDAVRNDADQFFSNPRSLNPQLTFVNVDTGLKADLERERPILETMLNSWSASLAALSVSQDLLSYAKAARENLGRIKSFLDKASLAVNVLTPTSNLSQTTVDAWKTAVSGARADINTALSNLTVAEEKRRGADSNLAVVENELALKLAGATPEEIAAQEAEVERARASVLTIRAQISKTELRAPFRGIITEQNAKVGEIAAANSALVSLISETQFEIEANVPEADIAKIKIGNSARVTLDAYGSDIGFDASVVSIDPAEKIIDGVATYRITLQFAKEDMRIRSGMTANIDIVGDRRHNVLAVPQRAISIRNGEKTVRILKGGAAQEVRVGTGLRGSDGNVEIVQGLEEGDQVILSND